jgi:hypothetical protein
MYDEKRAARVGAKKLRQRQDNRMAKRQLINEDYDDLVEDSEEQKFSKKNKNEN